MFFMNNKKILGIAVFILTLIAALGIALFKGQDDNGLRIPFITPPEPTPTEVVKGDEITYQYDSNAEPHEPQPFENNPSDDPAFTYKDVELTEITSNPEADSVHLSLESSEYIGIFYILNKDNQWHFALVSTLENLDGSNEDFYQGWIRTKDGQTTSLGKLERTPIGTYVVKGKTNSKKEDIVGVFVTKEQTEDKNPETVVIKADATNQ